MFSENTIIIVSGISRSWMIRFPLWACSVILRETNFRQVGLDKTLSRAGRCGASRRIARQLSTSGSALCVDFGEFCFVLKVPLFRIVAESINKKVT
jgi:hypothetical protein